MKSFLPLLLAAALTASAEPAWNPSAAAAEAERDIHSGQIKFYWSGSVGVQPVGVPLELARKYPRENAGVGWVVTDVKFREQQEEYARPYNEKILGHLQKK